MPHRSPTSVPTSEAQSLRERIGRENMTQSSVLATRRLDEALLRLDRAAGRSRDRDEPAESPTAAPRPIHRTGLELDQSVIQNTSLWLESDNGGQQLRMDAGPARPQPAAPHIKTSPPPQPSPASSSLPVEPHPGVSTQPLPDAPGADFSDANFEALFTQPIDVMILATTARIASLRDDERFVPPAVPESNPKPATATAPELLTTDELTTDEQATEPASAEETVCETQTLAASDNQEENITPEVIRLHKFAAAWQVNEFVVPSTIDELFLRGSIAEQLAARLATARQQGLRTIAVTSTQAGEGRSTVAIGLALSVAFSGLRVALLDADREGVNIASDLHLDLDESWLDAIRNRLPLEEVAVYSVADAITLLPLLKRTDRLEAPFVSSELQECLTRLRNSFDLIIVDCGASALADVTLCDTCLIVRDIQRTKAAEVETLALSLRRSGSHGVGIVENFC